VNVEWLTALLELLTVFNIRTKACGQTGNENAGHSYICILTYIHVVCVHFSLK